MRTDCGLLELKRPFVLKAGGRDERLSSFNIARSDVIAIVVAFVPIGFPPGWHASKVVEQFYARTAPNVEPWANGAFSNFR
jgi:hypothetical protein